MRFLFGEDIFISYSRYDAMSYAATLASRLAEHGFSCSLDQWNTAPGQAIPRRVLRALGRSSMLVLVGSSGASGSAAVEREVRQFLASQRPIVPISVGGALEASPWFSAVAGASLSAEDPAALAAGLPSAPVLNRIESSFRFVKRNQRVRRSFLAAAVGLLALTAVAAWAARDAHRQQRIAGERLLRAQSVELAASSRSRLAAEPDLAALLAVESLRASDTFEARRALLSVVTDRPLLEAVLIGAGERREQATEDSDAGRITAVTFNRNGTRVAAKEWHGEITVWDLSSDPIRGETLAQAEGLSEAQISPDFSLVAGLSPDGTRVHLRPTSSTRPEVVFNAPADQEIDSLALSPDASLVALGSSDGIVTLWNTATGEHVGDALSSSNLQRSNVKGFDVVYPLLALRFSGDGATLHWIDSSGTRGAAEVPAGQPAAALPPEVPLDSAAWSADGKTVAIRQPDGGLVRAHLYKNQIDGSLETLVSRSPYDGSSVGCAAISADGWLIAAGMRDGSIRLYDRLASVSPSAVMAGHAAAVTALAVSVDGTRLVSGSDDGTLMLWRTRGGLLERKVEGLSHSSLPVGGSARFTPDGARLLATAEKGLAVVDPEQASPVGQQIDCDGSPAWAFSLAPDGQTIAIASGPAIYLADLATRACSGPPLVPNLRSGRGSLGALAFSGDGRFLASGAMDGALVLWDVATRGQVGEHLNRPDDALSPITSLAWTPGRGALLVGSVHFPRLWATGIEGASDTVLDDGDRRSRTVALSRDGLLMAGSSRDGVFLWDAATGQVKGSIAIEKNADDEGDDTVTALALSAIDGWLAVGQDSGRLTLFDVARQQWVGELPRLAGCYPCAVSSLDFCPNAERLAAVIDGELVLWTTAPEAWAQRALQIANRELTPAERGRYLGNE